MYYKEYLLLRKGILIFAGALLILALVGDVMSHSPGNHVSPMSLSKVLLFFLPWLVALFATIYATSIGQDSGENARLALVRPLPRPVAAGAILGMGALAVVVALALGTVAFYLPFVLSNGLQVIDLRHSYGWLELLLPLFYGLAMYGAASAVAVFARRTASVAFIIWPVCLVLYMFSASQGRIGDIIRDLNLINPVAYFITSTNLLTNPRLFHHSYGFFGNITPWNDALVLSGLFFAFTTLAAVRYSRLEV